nr:hypothetical protein [Candidatus Sigynarchaeota archaeon]
MRKNSKAFFLMIVLGYAIFSPVYKNLLEGDNDQYNDSREESTEDHDYTMTGMETSDGEIENFTSFFTGKAINMTIDVINVTTEITSVVLVISSTDIPSFRLPMTPETSHRWGASWNNLSLYASGNYTGAVIVTLTDFNTFVLEDLQIPYPFYDIDAAAFIDNVQILVDFQPAIPNATSLSIDVNSSFKLNLNKVNNNQWGNWWSNASLYPEGKYNVTFLNKTRTFDLVTKNNSLFSRYGPGLVPISDNDPRKFGDLDGDGILDVAAFRLITHIVNGYYGVGDGSFAGSSSFSLQFDYMGSDIRGYDIGDFYGADGMDDILIINTTHACVFYQDTSHQFMQAHKVVYNLADEVLQSSNIFFTVIKDINEDGLPDLFIAPENNMGLHAASILVQQSTGGFNLRDYESMMTTLDIMTDVLFKDFDNNGYPDAWIAGINGSTRFFNVFLNDGNQLSSTPSSTLQLPVESNGMSVQVVIDDLNKDNVMEAIFYESGQYLINISSPIIGGGLITNDYSVNMSTSLNSVDIVNIDGKDFPEIVAHIFHPTGFAAFVVYPHVDTILNPNLNITVIINVPFCTKMLWHENLNGRNASVIAGGSRDSEPDFIIQNATALSLYTSDLVAANISNANVSFSFINKFYYLNATINSSQYTKNVVVLTSTSNSSEKYNIELELANPTNMTWALNWSSFEDVPEGDYNAQFEARTIWNITGTSEPFLNGITVDLTAPTVNQVTVTTLHQNGDQVEFIVNASDVNPLSSVTVRLKTSVVSGKIDFDIALTILENAPAYTLWRGWWYNCSLYPNGLYEYNVSVVDVFANLQLQLLNFSIALTLGFILEPEDIYMYSDQLSGFADLSWIPTGPSLDAYRVYLDGVKNISGRFKANLSAPYEIRFSIANLTVGTHRLTCSINNTSGTVVNSTITVRIFSRGQATVFLLTAGQMNVLDLDTMFNFTLNSSVTTNTTLQISLSSNAPNGIPAFVAKTAPVIYYVTFTPGNQSAIASAGLFFRVEKTLLVDSQIPVLYMFDGAMNAWLHVPGVLETQGALYWRLKMASIPHFSTFVLGVKSSALEDNVLSLNVSETHIRKFQEIPFNIILSDSNDIGISGAQINISISPLGTANVSSGITDSLGRVFVSMVSNYEGNTQIVVSHYTLSVNQSIIIGVFELVVAEITGTFEGKPADNESMYIFRVVAYDNQHNPITGIPISIQATIGLLNTTYGFTGSNGEFYFSIKSTYLGRITITISSPGFETVQVRVNFAPVSEIPLSMIVLAIAAISLAVLMFLIRFSMGVRDLFKKLAGRMGKKSTKITNTPTEKETNGKLDVKQDGKESPPQDNTKDQSEKPNSKKQKEGRRS